MAKVDIVIPTYNRVALLPETLKHKVGSLAMRKTFRSGIDFLLKPFRLKLKKTKVQ